MEGFTGVYYQASQLSSLVVETLMTEVASVDNIILFNLDVFV